MILVQTEDGKQIAFAVLRMKCWPELGWLNDLLRDKLPTATNREREHG
jgi:hypothetical protein